MKFAKIPELDRRVDHPSPSAAPFGASRIRHACATNQERCRQLRRHALKCASLRASWDRSLMIRFPLLAVSMLGQLVAVLATSA
jgi:hypothetical protein